MSPLTLTCIGDLTSTLCEQFKAINKGQWLFTVEPGQTLATYGAHVTRDICHKQGHGAVKAKQ